MPSSRPDAVFLSRPAREPKKGMAHDYRLMVEAVQAGDLDAARKAYGRMMERLSSIGSGADDTLTKIGASLRHGDLVAANRMLDRLESRALRVLRGLREHADLLPPNAVPLPPAVRKPN